MAARKKRRKSRIVEKSNRGRKPDSRRFELEVHDNGSAESFNVGDNEVIFLVRTSGGSPLKVTHAHKLEKFILTELKAMGHKLLRKGQELDPVAPPEPPPPESTAPEMDTSPTADVVVAPPASLADPDDSDAHTTTAVSASLTEE